jgi:hypothetical protein
MMRGDASKEALDKYEQCSPIREEQTLINFIETQHEWFFMECWLI